MSKKKDEELSELERLHGWLSQVGGNITLGSASLDVVEASKSGNKLTIVLKKPKPAKPQAA